MKSLAHEILSFCKSVLDICLIKAQKATSPCSNGGTIDEKTCIIPLVGGSHLSLGCCWL